MIEFTVGSATLRYEPSFIASTIAGLLAPIR
jgi:hypothetical protein